VTQGIGPEFKLVLQKKKILFLGIFLSSKLCLFYDHITHTILYAATLLTISQAFFHFDKLLYFLDYFRANYKK
jgi:hypothetical protein